jgi:hypothetical protein
MISPEQEKRLSEANSRSKKKQDKKNPHVININDGRLMPNTPGLRKHPAYRVYGGSVKDDLPTRMRWLAGQSRQSTPRVVNSMAEQDAFDVGTATADDLAVFALEQWGMVLNTTEPLPVLRKRVMEAAAKAEQPAEDLT